MAKCSFDIEVKDPIDELIEKAKNGISNAGGAFQGDNQKGAYNIPTAIGSISGTYETKGSVIHFEISDKPGLIGCGKIEKELRKYLGENS